MTIVPFPEMKHGWTVRGDMNDAAVHRDVIKVPLGECIKSNMSSFLQCKICAGK